MMKKMLVTTWATVWYFKEVLFLAAMVVASLHLTYKLGYLHGMYGY